MSGDSIQAGDVEFTTSTRSVATGCISLYRAWTLYHCNGVIDSIITINNTLGRSVRIVMAYATDGENEEVKYYQPAIEIAPGVNVLHVVDDLNITTLDPREIKTIKLVTSRGAIIQPPYCREIVKRVITYEQVIQYIVRRLQGFPVNLYLGEEQIPGGIPSEWVGGVFSHGFLYIETNNTVHIINGTTVNKAEFSIINWLKGDNYGPAFYIRSDIVGSSFTIERYEVGDYIVLIIDTATADSDTDDEGCIGFACKYWETSSVFWDEDTEFIIKKLAINYVTKAADSDASSLTLDPIQYLLVNSGYDYLVVGLQCEAFDPYDEGINTFNYSGEIYLYIGETSPSNVDYSNIKITFNFEYDSSSSTTSLIGYSLRLYKRKGDIWEPVGTPLTLYRKYYEWEGFWGLDRRFKVIDQVGFIIPHDLLKEIGLKSGDYVWITARASFITDTAGTYEDFYGTDTQSWYKYIYSPTKSIVDSWYKQYFGD